MYQPHIKAHAAESSVATASIADILKNQLIESQKLFQNIDLICFEIALFLLMSRKCSYNSSFIIRSNSSSRN